MFLLCFIGPDLSCVTTADDVKDIGNIFVSAGSTL